MRTSLAFPLARLREHDAAGARGTGEDCHLLELDLDLVIGFLNRQDILIK
jgi:hypothetical protein